MILLKKSINILILDDHPLVCAAIENLVEKIDFVNNVLTSIDTKGALDILKLTKIDLLILDVNLGDNDGFDFYRRIKSHGYTCKVLFVSANDSQLYSSTAFNLGADGYICKSENLKLIKESLDGIMNGYRFFKFNTDSDKFKTKVSLSNRETIVFNYLIQGKTNKEIATVLSLSTKTISTYKKRIFDKYGINNVVDLVKISENLFL